MLWPLITATASLDTAANPLTTGDTWEQRKRTASNRAHLSEAHISHARALHSQRVLTRCSSGLPLCWLTGGHVRCSVALSAPSHLLTVRVFCGLHFPSLSPHCHSASDPFLVCCSDCSCSALPVIFV